MAIYLHSAVFGKIISRAPFSLLFWKILSSDMCIKETSLTYLKDEIIFLNGGKRSGQKTRSVTLNYFFSLFFYFRF